MILDTYQSFRPANAAHTDTGDLSGRHEHGDGGSFVFKISGKGGVGPLRGLTLGAFVFFVGLFHKILNVHWPKPLLPLPETILKTLLPWLN
jgi:hypothetical protein